LGIGNLDVDLSAVSFPAQGEKIDVSLGVGHLTVEVPHDAVVTVDAHAGAGQVDVFGNSGRTVQLQSVPRRAGRTAPHLTLDARVGMGYLQVTRG
jgi:predicted membrane protein